jgi:hypothetical protein
MITSNWGSSSKLLARQQQMLMYQKVTGNKVLPSNLEYWTMCGRNLDANKQLIKDSEFDQLTSSGFIKPKQWHGVELDEQIAADNKCHSEGNWYQGTLVNTFLMHHGSVGFINIDHHRSAKFSCNLLHHIFNSIEKGTFVSLNMVQSCFFYRAKEESMYEPILRECYPLKPLEVCTEYNGVGDNKKTIMKTFYFYKQ